MKLRDVVLVVALGAFGRGESFAAERFINPDAPEVVIPEYSGERYEVMVPDTLDIAERARLAIHGLTSPVDPEDDYALYWHVDYSSYPPRASKEDYVSIRAKYMEALPLLRIASGSMENLHVDRAWTNSMLKTIGPDGLLYSSMLSDGKPLSHPAVAISRQTSAMMIHYLRDGNPMWKEIVETLILRLSALAIDKGDYAYFYNGQFTPGTQPNPNDPVPKGIWSMDNFNGRFIQPLGQYYTLTGFEPAKRLGDKLVNYVLNYSEYYGPDGEWTDTLNPDPGRESGLQNTHHFGTHSHMLLNMLDYALCTENAGLLEYVGKSFAWAKERNSTMEGQSETATSIGFFVEFLHPYYATAEHCSVADMVAIAIKLSQAGAGDHWDDADRWVRNHFAENQVMSPTWIQHMPIARRSNTPESDRKGDRIAEEHTGTFFSWPAANDGCPTGLGHMHCCMGNGSRTLYYIWKNILGYQDGNLKVNLLLNRASEWADLDSYIPYTGRVDLKIKKSLKNAAVRIPDWIEPGSADVVCTVNGAPRSLEWSGRFVNVGPMEPGDLVTLDFPIWERMLTRWRFARDTVIGGVNYDLLVFRGHELVLINPGGTNYPYYRREHYRQENPRWRKVERFISNESISW